jgi:hypothetical protein
MVCFAELLGDGVGEEPVSIYQEHSVCSKLGNVQPSGPGLAEQVPGRPLHARVVRTYSYILWGFDVDR